MDLQRVLAIFITGIFLYAPPVGAYDHPLNYRSVSEAYSLGRRHDEKLGELLAQYVKRLPAPKSGPYVSSIEIRTPFVQVVWRAHDNPMTYREPQAEKDYVGAPEVLLVRAQIYFTRTYPSFTADDLRQGRSIWHAFDFSKDFRIHLTQDGEIIAKETSFRSLYSDPEGAFQTGGEVTWEFDDAQLHSRAIQIQVLTPDGQTVEVEFDLRTLR